MKRACLATAALWLAPALAPAAPAKAAAPIWPLPREARVLDDRLLLTDAVIVVPDGPPRAQRAGRLLAEILQDQFLVALPVVVGQAPEGRPAIVVGEVGSPEVAARVGASAGCHPEGYLLRVEATGALVAGCDARGARYGVSSLVQLVHRWGTHSLAARKAEVRDWPLLPIRWVHVFMPGQDQLAFTRRYLRDFLLRYKFNGLVLETGGGMRLETHPEISSGWRRTVREWYAHGETMPKIGEGIPLGTANRFAASLHVGVGGGAYLERDEVRRLAEWADDFGLEIVPEIQSLTHSYYIAAAHREVAEDPDMEWPDSYCPSNEASYRILFDVMDEYLGVLKPRRVHVGHDEWRAGAFCPRCRGKDPGRLYAEDVLRIQGHLREKGIETWMWGDHLVDGHNRFGRQWSEGGFVRYERPDTSSARDILAAANRDIHVTNWSGEEGDLTFRRLGWPFVIGNLQGTAERDWAGRLARGGALGGEVSSWCALEEFQLGKLHFPEALYSANLLWSGAPARREDALAEVGRRLVETSALLAATPPPSLRAHPMRFEVQDLGSALNHAPKGEGWDLSGLRPGRALAHGLPFHIEDPARRGGRSCIVVGRRPGEEPLAVELPVTGRWASLVFVQSATAAGAPPIHAGDQTHFPRESSELLGVYEIRFRDGVVATHGVRYDENVGRWDAGFEGLYYHGRTLVAGTLPDGRDAVVWGSEWVNPRPDVEIASVRLVGSPGPSAARPVLLAVTAVEKPRVEDER
ncbi:MAG: glycoside hydrolase family 20 zincin-like fold domain-containing protein [Betaproteobacteria bacterium]